MVACGSTQESSLSCARVPPWLGRVCACSYVGLVGLLVIGCTGAIAEPNQFERGERVARPGRGESDVVSGPGGQDGSAGRPPVDAAGDGGGGADGPGARDSVSRPSFACAGDSDARTTSDGLRRLTMAEYAATVRDLIAWSLPDAAPAILATLERSLNNLPIDRREPTPQDVHGSYRRLDQTL
jgi:hypothetical protein